MICKNNKTGAHFNYEFIGENLVNIWNPDKKYGGNGYSKMITYNTWLDDYTIVDKWQTIKSY